MEEINGWFESVHPSQWLKLVADYTFQTQLESFSLDEEAALLAVTLKTRHTAPIIDEDEAKLANVTSRLDDLISKKFAGAAFVKLGDCAPKVLGYI
jgi:murein tripeptide amidase MpaA